MDMGKLCGYVYACIRKVDVKSWNCKVDAWMRGCVKSSQRLWNR
jgi:hypothetical protein